MKIIIIAGALIGICGGLLLFAPREMSLKQSAAAIQIQKYLASQATLPGVPDDSKTPLKLFENYFAAEARIDASEFDWFTKRGIERYFDDSGELTEEDRKNISDGAKEIGTRGHKVVGFWYHADAERPSIVYGYIYLQNGKTSVPVMSYEEIKLGFIKTKKGWRIDEYTALGGW